MKQIFIWLVAISICYLTNGLPTISPLDTSTKTVYVLSALEHHEEIPTNAIEIQPDAEKHKDIPEGHILKKKIVALPINEVNNNKDIKVLTNEEGHPILAHAVDASDEEMETAASSIVFRPLFSYRRQQAARRRYYIPSRNYDYIRNQNYNCCVQRRVEYPNYKPTKRDTNYPDWYNNAQFPALT